MNVKLIIHHRLCTRDGDHGECHCCPDSATKFTLSQGMNKENKIRVSGVFFAWKSTSILVFVPVLVFLFLFLLFLFLVLSFITVFVVVSVFVLIFLLFLLLFPLSFIFSSPFS